MNMAIWDSGVLCYLLFEIFLFVGSFCLVSLVYKNEPLRVGFVSEFSLLFLAVKLLLNCFIPLLLVFAAVNYTITYFILSIVGICLVFYFCMTRQNWLKWREIIYQFAAMCSRKNCIIAAIIFSVFLPLLLFVAAAPDTGDSIAIIRYFVPWSTNQATPYQFFYHYVSFWEMAYQPSWLMSRSDWFLWLPSLQAVLLIALAGYRIARQLGISYMWSIFLTVNGMSLYFFWHMYPTGVRTIKNDMIYNAGILLLLSGLIMLFQEKHFKWKSWLAMFAGVTFMFCKFSGPFLLVALIGLSLGYCFFFRRDLFKTMLLALGCTLAASMLTTGHYYLHNLFLFSNPFYPINLDILGFSLVGPLSFQGTSLVENFSQEMLAHLLGVYSNFQAVGILFPIMLFGVVLYIPVALLRIFKKQCDLTDWLFWVVIVGWILFFTSLFSAGDKQGSLKFISDGMSLRYVTAIIFITSLLFFYNIRRLWPKSGGLLFVAFLVDSLWKIYALYFSNIGLLGLGSVVVKGSPIMRFLFIALGCSMVGVLLLLALSERKRLFLLCVIMFVSVFGMSPHLVENARYLWLWDWQPLKEELYNSSPMEVYAITFYETPSDSFLFPLSASDEAPYIWPPTYMAVGHRHQHTVQNGSVEEMVQGLRKQTISPGAVVITTRGRRDLSIKIAELENILRGYNYRLAGNNKTCAVFKKI